MKSVQCNSVSQVIVVDFPTSTMMQHLASNRIIHVNPVILPCCCLFYCSSAWCHGILLRPCCEPFLQVNLCPSLPHLRNVLPFFRVANPIFDTQQHFQQYQKIFQTLFYKRECDARIKNKNDLVSA